MNKKDLAERIIEDLLDDGMINLEYSADDWEVGKEECINKILTRLNDYYIISGQELK